MQCRRRDHARFLAANGPSSPSDRSSLAAIAAPERPPAASIPGELPTPRPVIRRRLLKST
jgi:hypothetical protein